MGPVEPYKNAGVLKDAYDPRTFIRSTVLPQAAPPAYHYRNSSTGKQERSSTMDSDRDLPSQVKHVPQYSMAAKFATDIAININSNPFFMTCAGVNKVEHEEDRIAIDTNL